MMLKRIFTSLAIASLMFMLCARAAHASGKMEVLPGQRVTMKADEIERGSSYKWVIQKGKDIISAQTGIGFNYEFNQPGEYTVSLATTQGTETIRTTSIIIKVGEKFPRTAENVQAPGASTNLAVTTLPESKNNQVHLSGKSKVLFNISGSPDIMEYRVDQNIFSDSDGNGTANDDIDNASDDSYLKGGYFQVQYDPSVSAKNVAEVTAVGKDGSKTKKQVEIIFDLPPVKNTEALVVLETNPAANQGDQIIYLYGNETAVAFYSGKSAGNIIEYRIDKNIFYDSNGDGDPGNDIDNRNHGSFKTGEIWSVVYKKTDGQIIAQLIAVGADGKGSRVQRAIKFADQPAPSVFAETQGEIRLTADKSFVKKGDPIRFSVQGLTLAMDQYAFAWDFDGDGKTDKEIEGDNSVTQIYDTAGTATVAVTVSDKQGHSGTFTLEVPVRDTIKTTADFEFTVEGNKANFTNLSAVSENLADKILKYQWSFGDSDEAAYDRQKNQIVVSDPSYTYLKAGTYIVMLTVTDADNVVASKTDEVTIEQDLPEEKAQEVVSEPAAAQSETAKPKAVGIAILLLKILLYLVLIVLVLATLLFGGVLAFFKLQHPDLTFDELIDEIKLRVLHKLGIENEMSVHEEESAEHAGTPMSAPQAILKQQDVIEGEVMDEPAPTGLDGEKIIPPKHPPETGELAKPEGPVPDWMKGV